MSLFSIGVGVLAIGSLAFFLVRGPQFKGQDYDRGLAYGETLLAGERDDEVRTFFGYGPTDHVAPEDRVDYLYAKTNESRAFGSFTNYDRGCLAALPSYSGK